MKQIFLDGNGAVLVPAKLYVVKGPGSTRMPSAYLAGTEYILDAHNYIQLEEDTPYVFLQTATYCGSIACAVILVGDKLAIICCDGLYAYKAKS